MNSQESQISSAGQWRLIRLCGDEQADLRLRSENIFSYNGSDVDRMSVQLFIYNCVIIRPYIKTVADDILIHFLFSEKTGRDITIPF